MSAPAQVRVRYAPSPTGYLHVGGVRTLLFNWLYARQTGGTLILRVEDTDQARSTREFEHLVLEDIDALGLHYDEGPDVGGPHAPYRQSERMLLYSQYARQLYELGKAYPCFCSADLISQKREAALKLGHVPHYDGTCSKLTQQEIRSKRAQGARAGLRFRVPPRDVVLQDRVRGEVEFRVGSVGDFFITRSPTEQELAAAEARNPGEDLSDSEIGMPVYNFSCVVDDHLMGITHVIRGEDHLSNTARQLLIYDGLGWPLPEFAHIAMVLGADRQKLSKRNGDVSAHEYLEQGYLPEALLNFLALLGWWPPNSLKPASGHPEVLTLEEMCKTFSLDGLQKAPAVFDVQKLRWMNGFYLRSLPLGEIAGYAQGFFDASSIASVREGYKKKSGEWFREMIDLLRSDATLLSDFPPAARFFFEPAIEPDALSLSGSPQAIAVIRAFQKLIQGASSPLDPSALEGIRKQISAETGASGKALFMPIRAAMTGKVHGPELNRIAVLLDLELILKRIEILLSSSSP